MKYNELIDIAIGRSRKDTHWRNTQMLWSEFVNRVSKTRRTAETVQQYFAETKSRQDEIKDVGGYVGGHINGGRRKTENILCRRLITLDIDQAKADTWETVKLLYNNATVVYSTHKHTPENPRLRLVMPLDRDVAADEYTAIARRIAATIGIDAFDDTTYEPARLMYWPSTPDDGEFEFHEQDGPWLSADEVLASYRDWRDASEWPVSSRVGEVIRHAIKKQGDPLEKPGLVGAFCRSYDIHQAIETFLPGVYAQCDTHDDRYTYCAGSTTGGLVVYEDKYTYSHHGTDPTSGKLCNAFDLVRLHLYGLEDSDTKDGTPANKMPSYKCMLDLCEKDAKVRKTLNRERAQSAADDFQQVTPADEPNQEPANENWADEMEVDRKGVLKGTIGNYEIILRGDPNLTGAFAYNAFRNTMDVRRGLPWRAKGDLSEWRDDDDSALRAYIEKYYETVSRSNIADAVANVYAENRYHPVRDYLNSLSWDKEPRAESLFIDYLGAEDCPYTRAITRKMLTAAIARVMRPGTKFDYVIVLVGAQGIGKSTILKKLGRDWFSDNFRAVSGKEAVEQIQGIWLMEIGELAGLRKADVEAIKSYISTTEDRCRLAYARRTEAFPRQCVFVATTNDESFLSDPTGNRRFWPLETNSAAATKDLFGELTSEVVGQIWAEAITWYKTGEPLYLPRELEDYARNKQEQHAVADERIGVVQQFLDTPIPDNWANLGQFEKRNYLTDPLVPKVGKPRNRTCVMEIWCECFGRKREDLDQKAAKDLAKILAKIDGLVRVNSMQIMGEYGRQRVYRRTKLW